MMVSAPTSRAVRRRRPGRGPRGARSRRNDGGPGPPDAAVTVLTSRLRFLDARQLARELVDAGFAMPAITAVRAHRGVDILLLATTWPDVPRGGSA